MPRQRTLRHRWFSLLLAVPATWYWAGSTTSFCAACSVLPLIRVNGSPTMNTAVPSTVAANPPGRAMRRSAAASSAPGGGFEGPSCASARPPVSVRVAARIAAALRSIIVWYMALHLSVTIRAYVPGKETAPGGFCNHGFPVRYEVAPIVKTAFGRIEREFWIRMEG